MIFIILRLLLYGSLKRANERLFMKECIHQVDTELYITRPCDNKIILTSIATKSTETFTFINPNLISTVRSAICRKHLYSNERKFQKYAM